MGATRKKEARPTKDDMVKGRGMGLSCGDAQAATKDRTLWRNTVVVALCPTGDEEYE